MYTKSFAEPLSRFCYTFGPFWFLSLGDALPQQWLISGNELFINWIEMNWNPLFLLGSIELISPDFWLLKFILHWLQKRKVHLPLRWVYFFKFSKTYSPVYATILFHAELLTLSLKCRNFYTFLWSAVLPLTSYFWFSPLFRMILARRDSRTAGFLAWDVDNFPSKVIFGSIDAFGFKVDDSDGFFFIEVDIFLFTLLFKFKDDGISLAFHILDECAG